MSLSRELARKALHGSTAVVPVAYAGGVARRDVLVLLGALVVVAAVVEAARARHAGVRAAFTGVTGALLREHEHRRLAGATWLLLAFLLAVASFPRDVAVAAMLGVSLGDAAGAVVGKAWTAFLARRGARVAARARGGPPRLQHAAIPSGAQRQDPAVEGAVAPLRPAGIAAAPKTLAGSVACALATALGAWAIARLDVPTSLLAGALAALAERPRLTLPDDNLRIVLAVGAGIVVWRMALS